MARIELNKVSLTFRVRQDRSTTLKEFVLRRLFRPSSRTTFKVRALQDFSLTVEKGQRLGIIGHNGAGKSTLLKLLAGVYPPSRGQRIVEGKVCSLFDMSLGFEPEATGWENIAYRSYLQGETPRTVRRRLEEIAAFSELGDFLNTPVRYYSDGMRVRLAFSIATSIDPEVLLIDEALAAGDLSFQKKARARMQAIIARAHLMVVVSHDLDTLQGLCDRMLWLDHGRIRQIGEPAEVIAAYQAASTSSTAPSQAA